jgi:hypothetical protein
MCLQVGGKGIELGRCGITLGRYRIKPGRRDAALGGYGIELADHAIDPTVKPLFYPVDLFRKHLVAFHNKIKLVLNGVSEGTDMARDHALDLFKVIFVHFYLAFAGGQVFKISELKF